MPHAPIAGEDNSGGEDDMDCSMPELGCDFSVADLGFEADSDDDTEKEAAVDARRRRAAATPRRLSLQQRRRLNLYSKPSCQLPALACLRLQHQHQPQAQSQSHTSKVSGGGRIVASRDTPTIHEEDSGVGSVTSPVIPDDEVDMPTASRGRTVSEPLDSADNAANEEEEGAAAAAGPADVTAKKPGIASRLRTLSHSHSSTGATTSRWPKALNLVFQNIRNDLWRDLPVSKMPEEVAIRHRYNAHKRQWLQDTVRVKMEPEPFNKGAMRECFRLKKLSGFSKLDNWHSRACNYVAKRYIETVDPAVYFEDVRLQMNAKLWAQEYNRHHPPKKVDIMQMCVIEFKDREGGPLYHLEHHIEGEYVKHNSNSGFVDENARRTPHALSHFTFERSGHQLIVVDIQGVDDIYTDPQIHTAEGTEYGDGNLGVRGMALFFSSHVCNEICRRLSLSQFDMAPSEISEPPSPMQTDYTCVRSDIFAIGSPMVSPQSSILDSGCSTDDDASSGGGARTSRRRRNTSGDEMTPEEELAALSAALKRRERPSCVQGILQLDNARRRCCGCDSDNNASQQQQQQQQQLQQFVETTRSRSDSENGAGTSEALPGMPEVRCRGPILGRIHHELTRLHDAGRLVDMAAAAAKEEAAPAVACQLEERIDWTAAVFHERLAARLGVVEAAVNLARLHLGLPADCLQAAPREAIQPSAQEGHGYMEAAARLGDRSAMLYLARAHDTGNTEGLARDWDRAAHYYQRALATSGQADREGGYDSLDTPGYLLRARLAELYLHGGHGLDADPAASSECYGEAAEEAMAEGNGKLAAKYYALAEEAAALVSDEEEVEGE